MEQALERTTRRTHQDRKPILALDIDDVVMRTTEALHRWHNRNHGTKLVLEDSWTFDLEKVWKCSIDERNDRINRFHQSRDHMAAKPIVGAKAALRRLQRDFEIHFVTSRHLAHRPKTLAWLKRHFNGLYSQVHFADGPSTRADTYHSKADVCKKICARLLIDDGLHNARSVAKIGIPVLLFDRPWNQAKRLPKLITRVHTWREIEQHVRALFS